MKSVERRQYDAKQRLLNRARPGTGASSSMSAAVPVDTAPGEGDQQVTTASAFYHDERLDVAAVFAEREQREHAYNRAMELAERDPEAAAFLLAQLEEAAPASVPSSPSSQPTVRYVRSDLDPFDPMRLYAQLCKYYGWGDEQVRAMPLKRLLAYFREMVIQQEKEDEAIRKQTHTSSSTGPYTDEQNIVDASALAAYADQPVPWVR
jgi:hypothetical protein